MPVRHYRMVVVGCALSWFVLGLHLPGLHRVTHHGAAFPPWNVVVILLLLAVAAVAGLWALLRAPGRWW